MDVKKIAATLQAWLPIAIVLLIVAGLIVLFLKLKGSFSDFFSGKSDVPDELKEHVTDPYHQHVDTVNDLQINQNNLTRARNAYKQIADRQELAMNGLGTNESWLFSDLENLNTDELKTVFMDFGMRATSRYVPFIGQTDFGQRQNLVAWYLNDLSGSSLERMKEIWKPTGLM